MAKDKKEKVSLLQDEIQEQENPKEAEEPKGEQEQENPKEADTKDVILLHCLTCNHQSQTQERENPKCPICKSERVTLKTEDKEFTLPIGLNDFREYQLTKK